MLYKGGNIIIMTQAQHQTMCHAVLDKWYRLISSTTTQTLLVIYEISALGHICKASLIETLYISLFPNFHVSLPSMRYPRLIRMFNGSLTDNASKFIDAFLMPRATTTTTTCVVDLHSYAIPQTF